MFIKVTDNTIQIQYLSTFFDHIESKGRMMYINHNTLLMSIE